MIDDDVDAFAEALGVGELLAIVHDVDPEAGVVRHLGDEVADVPGAEDVDLRRCLDRLDEDFHLAAADEPGLLREVVVQLVLHAERAACQDRLARLPERVVLVAAAADGADRPAVGVDEHLGADALRGRAGRAGDGDERHFLAARQRFGEGGEDFLVHNSIIGGCLGCCGAWCRCWPRPRGLAGQPGISAPTAGRDAHGEA